MNLLKQHAKQFIKDHNFIAAKQVILTMLENEANQDFMTYSKLGDVCVELNEYSEALSHYQNAAEFQPNNAVIYVKIGECYEHLNHVQLAIDAYETSIGIKPTEPARVFYAKLLIKQKRWQTAERLLLKCSTQRASVNYYRGVLLRQRSSCCLDSSNALDLENALRYFERAMLLKPAKYAYHHTYAQCLDEYGDIESANKAYLAALEAMHSAKCEDSALLFDYAVFRYNRYNDDIVALQYLQEALDMEGCTRGKHSRIESKKREIEQRMQQTTTTTTKAKTTKEKTPKSKKTTITYSWEHSIAYWQLPALLQVQDVQQMSQRQIEDGVFGGADRLNRLRLHFGRVLSAHCKPKLVVVCVSVATPIVIQLLMRVGLLSVFDAKNVIHSTLIHDIDLELPSKQLNDFSNGLAMDDLKRIECRLNVFNADQFDIDAPSTSDYHNFIDSMRRMIETVPIKKNYWTILNVLSKAFTVVHNDDLLRWYAVCLAGIGHNERAQTVFVDLVSRKNVSGTVEYALFLLSSKRHYEAKEQFDQILCEYAASQSIEDWIGCIYCGYAQCLEAMDETKECEQFFEAALKAPYRYKPDGYRHYYYGLFLFRKQRWADSQHQFQNALSCDKTSDIFHYAVSQSLFKTKQKKIAKAHWNKAVYSQVHVTELKKNFYAKFERISNAPETEDIGNDQEDNWYVACASTSRSHDSSTTTTTTNVEDLNDFAHKFNNFWLDRINEVNPTFNKYYDRFVERKLNDIRIIWHARNLEFLLREEIGIETQEDIELIVKHGIALQKEQGFGLFRN